ncbi:MAG: serine/threonine-protein kinase [Sandaracinaceae bacterium]
MVADPEADGDDEVEESWLRLVAGQSERLPMRPPATPSLGPGVVVGERHRLVARIGGGAMGTVYEAVRLSDGRAVALKVIRADVAEEDELNERFAREAHILRDLRHRALVPVLDFGLHEGRPFFAMELLRGETLRAFLSREGAVTVDQGRAWIGPALDALQLAHDRGIVHRDLKTENLFLDRGASPLRLRILDFGLAKVRGDIALTASDAAFGTPAYMAPEQLESAKKATAKSDQYAVAAILYEMLTRRIPHRGRDLVELSMAKMTKPPEPIPPTAEVPDSIQRALARALAKDPKDRYPNLVSFKEAILQD